MRYIALDLGSTWTKTAYLADGRIIEEHRVATPPALDAAQDRYEIDAEAYFHQVQEALQPLAARGADALLISTQMHGCVLTDQAFRPVTPYISWRDGLGRKRLQEIGSILTPEDVSPSGVPLKANLALCALLARRLEGETWPQGARFCTLGGYIIGRLTGGHVCHMTNAAPCGLADVRKGCWNRALIDKAGLAHLQFPQIATDLCPVGQWQGMAVYADLGDQQVCAAGAELALGKTLHISVGTAGLIGALTEQWGQGPYENRPWLTAGRYLRTVSGLPGGRHMAGLASLLQAAVKAATGQETPLAQIWSLLKAPHEPAPSADLWDILSRPVPQMLGAYYAAFGAAYAQAAEKLALPLEKAAFSGGAASRNGSLRQAVCTPLNCRVQEGDHDVWRGMLAIIRQIEQE